MSIEACPKECDGVSKTWKAFECSTGDQVAVVIACCKASAVCAVMSWMPLDEWSERSRRVRAGEPMLTAILWNSLA